MSDLTKKGLKLSHLRFAAVLSRERHITSTAARLGITQPAASRLAAEVEAITGAPMYRRSGRGIELTKEGEALAMRAERVLREIEAAERDISEISAGVAGNVRIGAVTGPALEHVLPMIRSLRVTQPGIRLEVEVATSDQLCQLVGDGRLDMALARLPKDSTARAFDYVHFEAEPLSLIARTDHPAFQMDRPLAIGSLLSYDWVMAEPGKILRIAVEAGLRERGHAPPARILNTSSFLLTLAMVEQTNSVAAIATSVAKAFSGASGIRILDVDCDFVVEPFGIVTRRASNLPPAAAEIQKYLVSRIGAVR